jgi:hypothetical protein
VSQSLNLKEIERKAWRSTFQDGLWDIYLGLWLCSMALSSQLETNIEEKFLYIIYFGFVVLAIVVLWAGKRFITIPRMGQVKFGPVRQSRQKKVRLVLFASVAFGLLAWFAGAAVWRGDFGQGFPWDVLFPVVYALNMLIVFGLGAFFLDFPRLYLIAVLFALPVPLNAVLKNYLHVDLIFYAFAVPALMIVCMGIFYLVRFLRENPIREAPDDSGKSQ